MKTFTQLLEELDYQGGHKAPTNNGDTASADRMEDMFPDYYNGIVSGGRPIPGWRLYSHGGDTVSMDRQTHKILTTVKGNPSARITIYRAVPSDVPEEKSTINRGDWVTVNKEYAKYHGNILGDYKIIEKTVKAGDIFTDGNSHHEFGYDPATEEASLQESLDFHILHQIPLSENVFRYGSKAHFDLINEAREQYNSGKLTLCAEDIELLKTDIGSFGEYQGESVPLDLPFITESRKVVLGKPMRGGKKKFYVYVRNPKTGKIKKIQFGDSTGLSVKINDPEARKSFVARHKCELKKDRMTAGYWACRIPYYAKSLGLSGGGKFFW